MPLLSTPLCLQDPRAVSQCGFSLVRKLQPSCTLWGCHGSGHLLCRDRQQGQCLFLLLLQKSFLSCFWAAAINTYCNTSKKKTGRKHWILLAGLALEYRLICYQQHVFYKKRGKYLTMVSLVFSLLEVNRGLQPFKNCPVFQLCLMNYIDLSIELDLNFFSLLNMSLQSTYPSWSW